MLPGGVELTSEEFNLISTLVYKRFGIKLSDQKRTLIIERLQKILRTGGFLSFKDYYDYVLSEPTGTALLTFIDRVSTHHTFFFRENEHFEFLKNIALPKLIEQAKKEGKPIDIRIWCAGCSSGEEPYTFAMVLAEYFSENKIRGDVGILATDISVSSIEKAQNGIYPGQAVLQLPVHYRQKYFTAADEGNFLIKDSLKKMILFRRLNLMRTDYPFQGKFSIISCRNVMIYFDAPTRHDLVERYYRYTEDGGYLFIGHSESIDRSTSLYKYVRPAIYQKS